MNPKQLSDEWDPNLNPGQDFHGVNRSSKSKYWWRCITDNRHTWQASMAKRTLGQGCPICRNLLIVPGINDLTTLHPELVKEIVQNSDKYLDPTQLSVSSAHSIEWVCGRGHNWKNSIRNRCKGQACPYCTGKKVSPGFNDLATRYPNLLSELVSDPEDLDPHSIFPSSKLKARWKCIQGHVWEKSVSSRAIDGTGCPTCLSAKRRQLRQGAVRKIDLKLESLAVKLPEIAESWAIPENLPKTTNDVYFADKDQSFWWKCSKGHLWNAKLSNRRNGHGCLVCAGKEVAVGANDFASQMPHLVGEFAHENGNISPSKILATSDEKYFWKCSLGHLYRSTARQRSRGQGCPFCSNKRVLAGFNDLRTLGREKAFEWNLRRNNNIQPDAVLAQSTKRYWWICKLGHEWQAQPFRRLLDTGCPICSNRQVLKGFNDIATRYPLLTADWDSAKNGDSRLEQISAKNHTKYFWRCASGHGWQASLANRINGSGCPSCASYGYNPNVDAIFYLVSNADLGAFKVGITNHGNNRLEIWTRLGWQTQFTSRSSGREILNLETKILRWLRVDLGLPQHLNQDSMGGHNGATETFELDSIPLDEVIQKIRQTLSHERQLATT